MFFTENLLMIFSPNMYSMYVGMQLTCIGLDMKKFTNVFHRDFVHDL